MGKGFAFVEREYPLSIEGTEEYIDLLFYNLNLHCHVVVEVKEFKSRDITQIGTYINIVDDLVSMFLSTEELESRLALDEAIGDDE